VHDKGGQQPQFALGAATVPGATIGALNTYAGRPEIIGDNDVELAEEVAHWVAIAIGNAEAAARTSEDLTRQQDDFDAEHDGGEPENGRAIQRRAPAEFSPAPLAP
jgi:GAF domain-containing protein